MDGKEYLDFICMFSAINQGHCHPRIVGAMVEQVNKSVYILSSHPAQQLIVVHIIAYLVNISTHNAKWPAFAKRLSKRFHYDQVSAMASGAEGADLAVKLGRKWGHEVKKIPAEKTLILGVGGNYHGLTSGVWNLQDPSNIRTSMLYKSYLLDKC